MYQEEEEVNTTFPAIRFDEKDDTDITQAKKERLELNILWLKVVFLRSEQRIMEKRKQLKNELKKAFNKITNKEFKKWIMEVNDELDRTFEDNFLIEAKQEYEKKLDGLGLSENEQKQIKTLRKKLLYYYKNVNQLISEKKNRHVEE